MGEINIFKVLADSQRRAILIMLKDGRLNDGEIAQKLNVTPAALSYHLKLLKGADLVIEYKEKNFIYYEINTSVFDELIMWIQQFGGKKMKREKNSIRKKLMMGISILSLIVTCISLQFLPSSVPIHYDIQFRADGWGDKKWLLFTPIMFLIIIISWYLYLSSCEKKGKTAKTQKEQAKAKSNAKIVGVLGVALSIFFFVLNAYFLINAYVGTDSVSIVSNKDTSKVIFVFLGVLYIVLGNFLPKTKKNHVFGVRMKWSMYNDVTWQKTNRCGAYVFVIMGILILITAVFANVMWNLIMMIVYMTVLLIIILMYSKKVYNQEVNNER